MATIRIIPPSPRFPFERYRVVGKIAGRQVQQGVYADPFEAKQAKLQFERELAAGKDPIAANQPLGYYVKYVWLPSYEAGQSREKGVRLLLNAHILPELGDRTLKELGSLTPLANWKKGLARAGYAPSTIDSILDLLSMILRRAVADGLLPRHPMCEPGTGRRWRELRVELPVPRPDYLTKPEADRLLEALAEPWRTFVLLMLYTGLRFGEATALEWRHLKRRPYFDGVVRGAALLRVEETIEDPDRCRPRKKPGAKTPRSVRSLAVQPWLVDRLDAYRERFPGGDHDLVFRSPGGGNRKARGTGGIIVNNNFNRMLKAACATAEIATESGKSPSAKITRSSHVTWLLALNVPLHAVQKRIGHKRGSRVTLESYAEVVEEFDYSDRSLLPTAGELLGWTPPQPGDVQEPAPSTFPFKAA